jgi:hypothetical protein
MARTSEDYGRKYWVVSPNLYSGTVEQWRNASVKFRVAFMGWGPRDPKHRMGSKFAGVVEGGIRPGDVILIARRYHRQPEIVGFGVVQGKYLTKVRGFQSPSGESFGSARSLRPFQASSGAPAGVPLIGALLHTGALAQLHPELDSDHKKVCEWMERRLQGKRSRSRGGRSARVASIAVSRVKPLNVAVVDLEDNPQLDYKVRTKGRTLRARRDEAALLDGYRKWLEEQGRKLSAVKYGRLRCDGFEKKRGNIIEAKATATREHIRMAVGQLLDYSFHGKKRFGNSKLAVLLPSRPRSDVEAWLSHLEISVIWRDGAVFLDNANGEFA